MERIESERYKIFNDSLSNIKSPKEIKLNLAKESFYIEQLGRETNYIILYVSILFGIFGLVGYGLFHQVLKFEIDKIDTKIHLKINKFYKQIDNISKLTESNESRLSITIGNVFSNYSDLIKKNYAKKAHYNLAASLHYFKGIMNCDNEDLKKDLLIKVKVHLDDCLSNLSKEFKKDDIILLKDDWNTNNKMLKDLAKCDNTEIQNILAEIRIKFKNIC